MRESAAHMGGDMAVNMLGARPVDPARLITADSFRALMAKLGPKPGAAAPPPAANVDLPPSSIAEPPPIETVPELAVDEPVALAFEPIVTEPSAPAESPEFDWSSLGATPPVEEAPVQVIEEVVPEPSPPLVDASAFREVSPMAEEAAAPPEPPLPPETVEAVAEHLPAPEATAVEPELAEETPQVITIDLNAVLDQGQLEWPEIVDSLNERLGTSSTLLKRVEVETDPFAQPVTGLQSRRMVDIAEPDHGSEDVARSLLDIMSTPYGASQPQERALAADTLLRLIPRLSVRTLMMIADRVSVMENPPPLLIGRLLRDPRDEVAGPLLERASIVTDQDLMSVIAEGDHRKQRLIARRRAISPALADALIASGEPAVLMALVRNQGAALSQDAFSRLCDLAREHTALQAPLATRPDTPAPIAFELFWIAPPDLRRLVLSRFLTDSETLNRILKITMAVDADDPGVATAETKLPSKQKLDELIDVIERGDDEKATQLLCELANICGANARRILADRQGEPLTVMLKALGLPRSRLSNVLERLRVSIPPRIASSRATSDLQAIFDTLSFNKTRVLLTYWDWHAQTAGPYAHMAA